MSEETFQKVETVEFKNTAQLQIPLLIGTPTLGTIRMEWRNACAGIVTPTNWAHTNATPIGYLVDDAQNIIVQTAVLRNAEWIFLLEDDTIPPADCFLKAREHIRNKKAPVFSGLYYIKGSHPPEPLIYRGRGTGAFFDWTPGEEVWCDGVPTGCLFIHKSIFKPLYDAAETYDVIERGVQYRLKRVFESPRKIILEGFYAQSLVGTSDLNFCDTLLKDRSIFKNSPWPEFADKEFPFMVDTSMKFGHIDRNTGEIF